MIELLNVSKRFGHVVAVEDVSLKVDDGRRLVIVGPSGTGKTTLLRLIPGLDRPDSGSVTVGGRAVEEIPPHERDLAFVFQTPALWPHMTLLKNAQFGAPRHSEERTESLFKELGIFSLVGRYPHEVSGGQAQRASLVRALSARKRTVLLDEPFTYVEEGMQDRMIALIDRCVSEDSAALVVASHDASSTEPLRATVFKMPTSNVDGIG